MFKLLETLNINNLIYLIVFLIIIYISRMVIGIMGISYSMTIMDSLNTEPLKNKNIYEYSVIIISIIWILIKGIIFRFYLTNLIFIPLIVYLLINSRNRKAKGIAFLILNISLLLL